MRTRKQFSWRQRKRWNCSGCTSRRRDRRARCGIRLALSWVARSYDGAQPWYQTKRFEGSGPVTVSAYSRVPMVSGYKHRQTVKSFVWRIRNLLTMVENALQKTTRRKVYSYLIALEKELGEREWTGLQTRRVRIDGMIAKLDGWFGVGRQERLGDHHRNDLTNQKFLKTSS